MSLGGYQGVSYRMQLFKKDCERRKLKTWQEKKDYAQKDKLWSKLIVWKPSSGIPPNSSDYYEYPLFPPSTEKPTKSI